MTVIFLLTVLELTEYGLETRQITPTLWTIYMSQFDIEMN